MIFRTILVVEIFSFQTHFISLIFRGTRSYGVSVLFDVSDASLKHPTKDVLAFQKHAWLRNRYVWSLFIFLLIAAIITALVVLFSEAESRDIPTSKAEQRYL
jgi:preprotein translocase subunit SecY